jgi:hypothetical protein
METHVGGYVVAALGFHGDAMDCAGAGIHTIDYSSGNSTVYSCWEGWQAAALWMSRSGPLHVGEVLLKYSLEVI